MKIRLDHPVLFTRRHMIVCTDVRKNLWDMIIDLFVFHSKTELI